MATNSSHSAVLSLAKKTDLGTDLGTYEQKLDVL
jgi:hypothetical protein